MGLEIPTEYGGAGCNFMSTILTVEEVAKVDGAVAALVDIHNTLVNSLIIKVASKEQKQKYLPKLAQNYVSYYMLFLLRRDIDTWIRKQNETYLTAICFQAGSFCLTEPGSGSDAFSLKTEAKKDGSDYVINGTKMWISNSDIAGVFLVFANANPSAVNTIFVHAKEKCTELSCNIFFFFFKLNRHIAASRLSS